jgi:hypothetical protein
VTANAASSSNGQLVVTYKVSENVGSCGCGNLGPALTASTGINDVQPINGASCRDFTAAQKTCLASLVL